MSEETSTDTDNLPDPTEYIPVIRHHLHEILLVLADAHTKSQAEDLIEAFRHSQPTSKESALSRRLNRSEVLLASYLGLLDEPEPTGPDPHEEGGV